VEWYLTVWRKYADFAGRARRREYWLFALANLLVAVILVGLDVALFGPPGEGGVGLFSGLYGLAVLVPSLAVTVRRLHDTDHSGWWLAIVVVPIIGGLVLFVFQVLDGTPGDNRFGPDPKGRTTIGVASEESDDATRQ
jgi:uncharacterized membrane protein YhaH (DUF805 family)